jgi:hypothetical protein
VLALFTLVFSPEHEIGAATARGRANKCHLINRAVGELSQANAVVGEGMGRFFTLREVEKSQCLLGLVVEAPKGRGRAGGPGLDLPAFGYQPPPFSLLGPAGGGIGNIRPHVISAS